MTTKQRIISIVVVMSIFAGLFLFTLLSGCDIRESNGPNESSAYSAIDSEYMGGAIYRVVDSEFGYVCYVTRTQEQMRCFKY